MLVHSLMDAFLRQSRAFAASRPSDNSLAPSAQPPLASFAGNERPLTAKAPRIFWLALLPRPLSALLLAYGVFQYLLLPPAP